MVKNMLIDEKKKQRFLNKIIIGFSCSCISNAQIFLKGKIKVLQEIQF